MISLSGSSSVWHGLRFDRGPALTPSGAIQATIFQEQNGLGSGESLTFRADNYKFQNYDGADEIFFTNGTLKVGNQIAGDNTDYSISVRRHGTSTNMGDYSGNTPCLEINDFSDEGPASPESAGLLYVIAGRIADGSPNSGNANLFSIQNDNGHAMVVKGNRRVGIGTNSPTANLTVNGVVEAISYGFVSDARFKKNVETLDNPLQKITQLQGVSYNWRKDEFPEFNFDDQKQIGFLAQDVEKVVPEAIRVNDKGQYSVNYATMIPLLVESVKTQQQQIAKLTEQNKMLIERLEKLEK